MLVDTMRERHLVPEGYNLTDDFCRMLIKAAPMHDLGKIAVDDAVLRKPGRFTPEEYEKMKTHAAEGARIVHEILKDTSDDAFHHLAENVAHYHHERWDGKGYPEGLKGDAIPPEARIMAVADVYDALVSKRVYKDSMSFAQADSIMLEGMGSQFDPHLKDAYEAARPKLEAYYSSLEDNGERKKPEICT
jgi:putative two-component system response regulator